MKNLRRTDECSLADLPLEIRKPILEKLGADEKPLACFRTEWHMLWVSVVTPKQLVVFKAILLANPIFIGKATIEMPKVYSIQLQDILGHREGFNKEYDIYAVNFQGKEGVSIETCFVSETDAKKFMRAIWSAKDQGRQEAVKPALKAADRLRELVELQKEGLITDIEFQTKREEILKDL
jgi:hypothetical protein